MSKESSIKSLSNKIKKNESRAGYLRTPPGRKACVDFAKTSINPLATIGDEMDKNGWLMGCENGVVELRTGDHRDGRQDDKILMASPVNFPKKEGIEAIPELFIKFLNEIFSGNLDLVDFVHRLLGYFLIGGVLENLFVVFSGIGRNGKSLLIEIVSKVLGPLAGPIRSEMLLNQNRAGNSSGPTPDIMALKGKRVVFASETDDGSNFSPSKVKWYSGGDTLTGRNPHDKYEVSFPPSHTLVLLTNNKPHAPADDFAFWERMVLIPFDLSFVNREPQNDKERRADPNLSEKLEKELPQILAWLIKGCLEYQRVGLNPPPVVKAAIEEYRRDEDVLADFIEESCIVGPGYTVGATKVYEAFKLWWKDNVNSRPFSQKKFGTLFKKRFEKKKAQTVLYYGVGLLSQGGKNDDI